MSSSFTFRLNANTQLRIRCQDESSNGSIMLKTADGILECVGCTEQIQERYTGDNWEFHYMNKTYSETIDEDMKWIRERNARPVSYLDLKKETGNRKPRKIQECDLLRRDDSVENAVIKHHEWDSDECTLVLHAERDFAEGGRSIPRTEYINVLLFFERIDFEKEAMPSANKRARRSD
jgi:hypothetical protein